MPVRRVLILYESSPNSPLVSLVDQGIESALSKSPYQIEYHHEYMETASFPDPEDQHRFRDFYIRKYKNREPDVVIAVGPSPLQFMAETHKESFPGIPVVFCLPNRLPGGLAVDSDFTGVEGDIAPGRTLAAALRLRPDTKHVIVVSGATPFDRQQLDVAKDQLRSYEGRLDISYLADFAMSDLLERLKHLPSHTIVILGALGRDATGNRYTSDQSGPLIVSAANAPVFSLNDRFLNHGEVGGDVANAAEQGKIAGAMALKALDGVKPKDIPTVKDEATYEFDWRAVKRWGMKEKNLPPGSIIINRPPSFWDLYKKYILAAIFILLAQMVVIFALLWQRARRRKAELDLVRSHERLRLSMETGQSVGWDWDIDTGKDHWFGDLQTMFGIPSDTFSAQIGDFYRYVHPEDREAVASAVADAKQTRTPYATEFRIVRSDGGNCWVASRGAFEYDAKGRAVRMRGMAVNITERKQAEVALASVSRRLIEVQEQERGRIARELHDDICQRLALLAVEIGDLQEEPWSTADERDSRLNEVNERIDEISAAVQSISRQLHSPQLEYLGIVPAMRSFCGEFSKRQGMEVDFVHDGIPHRVPSEISLCLFRILQEALHNAAKYSNVRRFEVRLWASASDLHLTVADHGAGFDPEIGVHKGGLGLVSMQERARLVNGTLQIRSKPMAGTTVQVNVPFTTPNASEQAAS